MINCPRCGATNPEDNRFCGKCGQVLSASGLLDHSPKSEVGLPDWLQESGSSAAAPQTPASPPEPSRSELPAWLSEIGVEDEQPSSSEKTQAPDWLSQLQQTPPASSGADELPPWLRSNDEPSGSAAAAAASPPQDLPDWLRDFDPPSSSAADTLAQGQSAPGWAQPDRSAAQALPPAAPDQLPDWLRELETEPPAPAISASMPAADDVPAWLREDPPALDDRASATSSRPGELPGWLSEFGTGDAATPASGSNAGSGAASAPTSDLPEVPNWLADFDAPAAPAAPAPPVDDVPPWLREESLAGGTAEAGPAARPETTALPGWLVEDNASNAGAQDLNVPLPDWSSEFGADLPPQGSQDQPGMDWLHATDQPAASSGATIPLAPLSSGSASDDVPDWLREMEQPAPHAASPSASADELPPWLAEQSPTAAVPNAPAPAQPLMPAEDLPSWLLDVDTPAPTQSTRQSDALPPWLADDSTAGQQAQPLPLDDPGATQPLASWLLDEPPGGSGAAQSFAEQSPRTADDFPAWLSSEDLAGSTTTPATAHSSDELPPWLASGDDTPGTTPSFAQASDELPPWLSVDEPAHNAQIYDQPSDELPPWLSGGSDAMSTPGTSHVQPEADALPPWLAATDQPIATVPAADQQADDLPPWLAATDQPIATVPAADQQADDLPPWLASEDPASTVDTSRLVAQEPKQSEPPSAETVEFPSWLSDATPAQPAPSGSTADADLPPWLSGIEAEAPAKPAEPASGLPSWLDEPSQPAKPKQPAHQSEFLGGLDLPAWLREEGDAQQPAAPVKEVAPDWLQKIAPETDEVAQVQQPVMAAPRVTRTPERVESMRLLEQMLNEPAPEPMPAPAKKRRSWLPLALGLLLLLLIGGAILFIILNPRLLNFGAVPVPAASEAARMIDGLAGQRPVVLAYEWDAQRLGDLRPLEETVVAHLATRRDLPLVFLSTDPQGALLASERAAQISRITDNFHDQYGLGYVNLGFKAGGPIALRQFAASDGFGALFAQDASGNDLRANDVVMQSMCGSATAAGCSWANVGLLIVIADEVEDVRDWFEQVRSQQPDLPALLLTTAEITPQVEPYAVAGSTQMLAGVSSAEAYGRARGVQDERLGRQTDAAAVGGAIFALLIVVGGPIAAFQGYRTRREAEVEEWEQ